MSAGDSLKHALTITPAWLAPVLRTLVFISGFAVLAFAELSEGRSNLLMLLLAAFSFGEGSLSAFAGYIKPGK